MRSIISGAALAAAIAGSPLIVCAQDYYVVVGAFAVEESASEFRGYLPGQVMDTAYTLTENENLLHYYVLRTSEKESAISKTLELKRVIDSWTPEETNHDSRVEGTISGELTLKETEHIAEASIGKGSSSGAASSGGAANAGMIPPKPSGKYFKFRIESPEGKPLAGQVHHVDFRNGRDVAVYNANTFVDLLLPGESSKPMAVVCGLFGYKEIHKFIDYANPSMTDAEAYVDREGAWVIPYKLERVEKGDVSLMQNVSFYKDAAIMRKNARTDLDELVRMMHENPYYEITVHAHCNGKNKREIIAPGASRNYFDVDGSVTIMGNAKDLTTLRAEAIRAYLSDNGVDQERVRIFSWGASDMIVKSDSPEAALNDRIEIEFTRD